MSSLGLFQTPSPFGSFTNSVASSINNLSVIPAHTGNPQPVNYSTGFTNGPVQSEASFWDQWLQSTVLNAEMTASLAQPYQAPVTQPEPYAGNDWVDTTLINSNFAYSLAEPAEFNWSEPAQPSQAKEPAAPATPASPKPEAKAEPAKTDNKPTPADNKPAKAAPKPSKTDNLLGEYEKAAGKFNSGGVASKGTLGEQELKDAQNQATKTGKSNDTLNFMVNNFSKYAGSDNKISTSEMDKALGQFKKEKGEPTYNFVA